MAIRETTTRDVARADMNDEFGVSVWQERTLVDYSIEDARKLAAEILAAAAEAERVDQEDQAAHDVEPEPVAPPVDSFRIAGEVVL